MERTQNQKPITSFETLGLPTSLEISQLEIKVEWVIENLIPMEAITLLHSIGGVGKSHLCQRMGKAIATGGNFFGLETKQMNVFYIDFENPLPEIVDRMKKIGGAEKFWIWHLGHDPLPIRFDKNEWQIYKTFPPNSVFIIDSLRTAHELDENSSKDTTFVMNRIKEIRALGQTFILIHHESKVGGYRGSTAWFDQSDHILKFSRVKKVGSDEDEFGDNFDLPIRLGLGGKSRFSSAMDLEPMYFKFESGLFVLAEDPDIEPLRDTHDLLTEVAENGNPPPGKEDLVKLMMERLSVTQKKARKLLDKGNRIYWNQIIGEKNKTIYVPILGKF